MRAQSGPAGIGNRADRPCATRKAELVRRLGDLAADDPERASVRAELTELYLPLARALARRMWHTSELREDLFQVAALALVQAVDGFDPDRGTDFVGYAVPTITGALKRHLRDHCWSVRVPRRLQELQTEVRTAAEDLCQQLQRSPRPAEIAARLGCSEEDVLHAMAASQAYQARSLSAPTSADGPPLEDLLGQPDDGLDRVEQRLTAAPLLAALPDRQRRILELRFAGDLSQASIAREVGISQMHVSRLLAAALAQLRQLAAAD